MHSRMSRRSSSLQIFSFLLITSTLLCLAAHNNNNSNSSDIFYDVSPFIIIYKNGTFRRLIVDASVPASTKIPTAAGVLSKDVVIDPVRHISARLFLPENAAPAGKLPLLVYFHGGAFVTGSAFSNTYNNFLSSVVGEAKAVGVSVNYRLAPEQRLPIAYQDSYLALKWALSHSKGKGNESWLRDYVDFNNVHLGGDSAGGNIAHNVAIRAGLDNMGQGEAGLKGVFLNCPHFWGNRLLRGELSDPKGITLMENIWRVAYPNSGFDDPASNPGMDPNISKLWSKRVLVYVAENDVLRDRGLRYVKTLRHSKWRGKVKVVLVKRVGHVFNLNFPNSTQAKRMLKHVAGFLIGGEVQ